MRLFDLAPGQDMFDQVLNDLLVITELLDNEASEPFIQITNNFPKKKTCLTQCLARQMFYSSETSLLEYLLVSEGGSGYLSQMIRLRKPE